MAAFRYDPLALALAVAMSAGVQCAPTPNPNDNNGPPTDPGTNLPTTEEAEPNNTRETATAVTLAEGVKNRVRGEIPMLRRGADVDYFNLGPVSAGDRLTLEVATPGSELKTAVAVFDKNEDPFTLDSRLFALQAATDTDQGMIDPRIDEIIRHHSSACYVVVNQAPRAGLIGGTYELGITVQRGGSVPEARPQTVWLNFSGGTIHLPDEGPTSLPPFDPREIDAGYEGQNAIVRRWIVATVRQNFARYHVTVLNSDDQPAPTEPYSTIYFGGYAPRSLGEALTGIDYYNADPSDDAVVFTQRFTDDLFTEKPDARNLGIAIGNVAAHEIGHLLGLNHVYKANDVMNGYDAPDNLLGDQRFKNSLLNFSVFPVNDITLVQDGPLLLTETVGRVGSAADVELPVCSDPGALAIADLNEDGRLDVVVACPSSREVRVLWNGGAGDFPSHDATTDFGATCVGVADLDGNGHPDIFGTDLRSDGIFVFLAYGWGYFASPQLYPAGFGPFSVTAADLNGDEAPDLAVANAFAESISILINRGDGTFLDNRVVSPAAYPASVGAGDFNDDGHTDLVVGNIGNLSQPGGISVLLGLGDGGFQPMTRYADKSLPYSVSVADLNRDGWDDIILGDRYSWWLSAGAATVLISDGHGGFATPAPYLAGDYTGACVGGDLNGDGWPDVAAANTVTGDVSVFLNRGDGTLETEWPYRVGSSPAAVAIGDLDGDGRRDLVVANQGSSTLSILFNRGEGRLGTGGP